VSPKTLIWYQCSFKAFDGATSSKEAINRRIVELRERGVSPITINSYLRCINAFLRWLHEEHQHDSLRIPRLREKQKVLATLTPDHMKRLLQFSPKGRNQKQAHTLTLLLLDIGFFGGLPRRFAEPWRASIARFSLSRSAISMAMMCSVGIEFCRVAPWGDGEGNVASPIPAHPGTVRTLGGRSSIVLGCKFSTQFVRRARLYTKDRVLAHLVMGHDKLCLSAVAMLGSGKFENPWGSTGALSKYVKNKPQGY
jgi:hypothetical protein